jgi:hypothetical protein
MLKTLFMSKNQKIVHHWEKEHHDIVVLATKVIETYNTNEHKKTKKHLKALNSLAVGHIMNEDIEFYKLLRDTKRKDEEAEHMIQEFTTSFKDTKLTLMNFLRKYTKDEVELDDDFFDKFNKIVEVLSKRIEFEEKNLYRKLKSI